MPPYKNNNFSGFIQLCNDTHILGQIIASAPRKVPGKTRSKNCFHYKKSGHFKRNCPAIKEMVIQPKQKADCGGAGQ